MPVCYTPRLISESLRDIYRTIISWLYPELPLRTTPTLPIEMIRLIITHAATLKFTGPLLTLDQTSHQPRSWVKPSFADLRGFSCATRSIRREVLAAWFQILIVRTVEDWETISNMGVHSHVTEIRILAPALVESTPSSVLLRFPRLHTVFFDSHNDFVLNTPQEDVDIPQPIGYYRLVVPKLPSTLRRLWITNAHGPDARVIQSVCEQCPRLGELWIERCTLFSPRMADDGESSGTHHCVFWNHFPNDHDAYFAAVGVEEYAQSLALELSQLVELEQLHMGLYLTPFEALEAHKAHHLEERIQGSLWGLVCQRCVDEFGDATRAAEQHASEALARNLLNLKQVSWSSYFTPNKAGRSIYKLESTAETACTYQGSEFHDMIG